MDITAQEKQAASKAVKGLSKALKSSVGNSSKAKSGTAIKMASAGSRFKFGRLQRITLKAPYYTFMQNHGFEGKKSNGVNMRLNATDVFAKAIDSSNILETLADEISEIRLDQVSALIKLNNR